MKNDHVQKLIRPAGKSQQGKQIDTHCELFHVRSFVKRNVHHLRKTQVETIVK